MKVGTLSGRLPAFIGSALIPISTTAGRIR